MQWEVTLLKSTFSWGVHKIAWSCWWTMTGDSSRSEYLSFYASIFQEVTLWFGCWKVLLSASRKGVWDSRNLDLKQRWSDHWTTTRIQESSMQDFQLATSSRASRHEQDRCRKWTIGFTWHNGCISAKDRQARDSPRVWLECCISSIQKHAWGAAEYEEWGRTLHEAEQFEVSWNCVILIGSSIM